MEKMERLSGSKPKFGDWIRGNFASPDNPQRDGMYVQTVRRTGRMNPGIFYRLTDGMGNFWEYESKETTFLGTRSQQIDSLTAQVKQLDGVRDANKYTVDLYEQARAEIVKLEGERDGLRVDFQQAKECVETLREGKPLGELVGKHMIENMARKIKKLESENADLTAKLKDAEARVTTLFDAIKHGDADHQAWLKDAIMEHFK